MIWVQKKRSKYEKIKRGIFLGIRNVLSRKIFGAQGLFTLQLMIDTTGYLEVFWFSGEIIT